MMVTAIVSSAVFFAIKILLAIIPTLLLYVAVPKPLLTFIVM